MYFDKTKIGTNIRNLRKAYGETQKELGKFIGYAENTISAYEKGPNVPDMETLQMIAKHYNITVESLLSDDFSKMNLKDLILSRDKVLSLFEVMHPIIYTENAMKDEHFAKAYKETLIIWDKIKRNEDTISERNVNRVMEEYMLSYQKTKTIEALVNMVTLIFVGYVDYSCEGVEKTGQAVYYGKGEKKNFAKKYLLKDKNAIGIIEDEQQKLEREKYYIEVICRIKLIKESSLYLDLADYYMALLFLRNMIDNDNGPILNQKIGMQMLMLLADLDNQYALSYLNKIEELISVK